MGMQGTASPARYKEMAIKKYRPTSPGRRGMTTLDNQELSRSRPVRRLTEKLNRRSGRNHQGRISVRHRGGGHRRRYRIIDFKRDKIGVVGRVTGIEYDPNRSARIALIEYADGEKRYMIAPLGLQVGATIDRKSTRLNSSHS